ncbi:ABC transporter permease [bacterium]|nr:ABC transporter permease [bacterium]
MIRNYLLVALRQLGRNKLYSLINILGFALGLTVCMVITLYVYDDLSFDRMHESGDRIVRLYTIDHAAGVSSAHVGITNPPMAPKLVETVPEVETGVRVSTWGQVPMRLEDETTINTQNMIAAGPSFFDVFDFEVLRGDAAAALSEPEQMLLTPTLAKRLFGDEDPIGKTVEIGGSRTAVQVTGIVAECPNNSHLQYDAIVSLHETENFQQWLTQWNSLSITAYLLLKPGTDPMQVEEAAKQIWAENGEVDVWEPKVQPLLDIHLHSSHMLYDNNFAKSDIDQVYALLVIGGFVLLIAAFNFMNLSTARSLNRAREVGMRKVVGARRSQMIGQFLGESILTTLIAMTVAVVAVEVLLPSLNDFFRKSLELNLIGSPTTLPILIGIAALVGVLAGFYPAIVLSSFRPSTVLKGEYRRGKGGSRLRQALVIGQFVVSAGLIASTLIVSQQLHFIRTMNPGYDRENVLTFTAGGNQSAELRPVLLEELQKLPEVVSASASWNLPGRTHGRTGVEPEGTSEDETWIVSQNVIDHRFLANLDIGLVEGRNFSTEFGSDTTSSILINEAVARTLGWDDPVGMHIFQGQDSTRQEFTVVGVVQDFQFASVRHEIEPMVFWYSPIGGGTIAVRLAAGQVNEGVEAVERVWNEVVSGEPFEYSFLDDEFNDLYQDDRNFASVVRGFSVLAIVIACLGLLGLSAYAAESRRKEIAVRKVLGSGEGRILGMLAVEFLKLVLIASVIAAPLAYFGMQRWLEEFVYRIDLTVIPFVLAALIAMAITMLTVSWQAWRAARTRPAMVLRAE